MGLHFEQVAAIVAGLITAPVVVGLTTRATVWARRREFKRAKAAPSLQPPEMAKGKRSRAEEAQDLALYHLIQDEHDKAKALQDRCIAVVVGASIALLAAFVASALSVTVLAKFTALHWYSAALDLAALVAVALSFRHSGQLRRQWISQRIVSEFMRQWAGSVWPLTVSADGLTARYDAAKDRVEAALRGRDPIEATIDLGPEWLRGIEQEIANSQPVSLDAFRYFMHRRPGYQLGWFDKSRKRIGKQHHRRRNLMAGLFFCALAAAGAKALGLALHNHALEAWSLFFLLIFIGLGAASTSVYVGQNQRTLRHRYGAQARRIQSWFDQHKHIVAMTNEDRPLDAQSMRTIAAAAAAFELLMFDELVDWIAITEDDSMELAPV
jgi:hypothetical protein